MGAYGRLASSPAGYVAQKTGYGCFRAYQLRIVMYLIETKEKGISLAETANYADALSTLAKLASIDGSAPIAAADFASSSG